MSSRSLTINSKQQGAVLVVSLIILLLMTIIGVSSMKTTTLEERMAGNMRDQNLSFQSAEAALSEGETFLDPNNNVIIVADGSAGIHDTGLAPNVFDPDTWVNNVKSVPVATQFNDDQNGRYYIEKLGPITKSEGKVISFDPSGGKANDSDITGYKVVAIGEGPSGTAQSILASYYGRVK